MVLLYASTAADSRQHALYSACMLVCIDCLQPSVHTQNFCSSTTNHEGGAQHIRAMQCTQCSQTTVQDARIDQFHKANEPTGQVSHAASLGPGPACLCVLAMPHPIRYVAHVHTNGGLPLLLSDRVVQVTQIMLAACCSAAAQLWLPHGQDLMRQACIYTSV
jgi:hypothetical protein